jgi:hypothetical protein
MIGACDYLFHIHIQIFSGPAATVLRPADRLGGLSMSDPISHVLYYELWVGPIRSHFWQSISMNKKSQTLFNLRDEPVDFEE